jgi:hippurate hydrolase
MPPPRIAREARVPGRPAGVVLLAAIIASGLETREATAKQPATAAPRAQAEHVHAWTAAEMPGLVALYRHLHAHSELSLQEKQTAERVAAELQAAGCDVTTGVGGHGVVAVLRNGDGPTLLMRADMDGLPVVEQTGLDYASVATATDPAGKAVGVMHACGHDVHMTVLIGAVRYLAGHRDRWRGTLVAIGQPAEERVRGARAMLEDGLFERFPRPTYGLALHVDSALAAGKVGVRSGFTLANSDSIDITVKGVGGHGAYPHTTVDPIVQAADLVLALQTIVSREVKPTEPAVITVGSIHGGTKHNIIGDSCQLQLTVRSYSDDVRTQLLAAIERKAKAVAASYRAPEPTITVAEGTPAVFNDRDLATRVGAAFRRVLGDERVTEAEQSMGGEDFSLFGRAGVPIVMYRLGAVEEPRLARYESLGRPPPSLHSATFFPDAEPTLGTGVLTMVTAVVELLAP